VSLTLEAVITELSRNHIDYTGAVGLGTDVMPFLKEVVKFDDPARTPPAVYLASLIPGVEDESLAILQAAATSGEPVIRMAAAAAVSNLEGVPADLVLTLLADSDYGVRKAILKSLMERPIAGVRETVQLLASNDPEPFLREFAAGIVDQLP
jgi:hypothetical protein